MKSLFRTHEAWPRLGYDAVMAACIRLATPDDAPGVHAIYAPVVRDTAISFELEPPSAEEMRDRITATLRTHPWLVCEDDSRIAGYAYASTHRVRAAYQWAADATVYNHEDYRRKGVGRALYTALFAILREQRFRQVCAGITLPNEASVGLHEAAGFQAVGVYRDVGFKLGAWHSVGWWQLALGGDGAPEPIRPFPSLDSAVVQAACGQGTALLSGR